MDGKITLNEDEIKQAVTAYIMKRFAIELSNFITHDIDIGYGNATVRYSDVKEEKEETNAD